MINRLCASATAFAFLSFVTSAHALDLDDITKGVTILNELTGAATQNATNKSAQRPRPVSPEPPSISPVAIREIQTLLAQLGYDPGPADGLMGRRTASAIRAFESDRGLAVTGVPDDRFLVNLREAAQHQVQRSGNTASSQPSFDCQYARTPTELAICGSHDLAELDRAVAKNYAAALDKQDAQGRAQLQAEQRNWIAERDRCGSDVMCLVYSLGARSQALIVMANAGDSVPQIPVLPVPSLEPETGSSTATGQAALPVFNYGGDAGNQSADIAAGLGNRPRFFLTNHFTPREDASKIEAQRRRIVTQLEYASDPGALNDDKFLIRLLDTLPNEKVDELIGRIYPGNMPDIVANNIVAVRRNHGEVLTQVSGLFNEFDRHLLLQEGRAMVERELSHNQLPNPIEVDLVCSVTLGAYDFDTKAFAMIASSCREGRFDVTGASFLTEFQTGPSLGPILMEVAEAREFSVRLGGNRQALVATPVELSVDKSGSHPKLLITETGPPVLHPMHSLEEVLYRYPAASPLVDEMPGVPEVMGAIDGMSTVPGNLFAMHFAPELLSEKDWLFLTERQIQHDQNGHGRAVFSQEEVAGRQPSFAAPELVGKYKDTVREVLATLDPSALIRMEIQPDWVAYRDGKLTSSEPWGFLREIYQDDRTAAMAAEMGRSALIANPGLLARANMQSLPRSLIVELSQLIRNVQLATDRPPRIPEIGMEPAIAEGLFAARCSREYKAMNDATANDLTRAHDIWAECTNRFAGLRDRFVFDFSVEFTGAKRWAQSVVLETHLTGADLYDLQGRRFASLAANELGDAAAQADAASGTSDVGTGGKTPIRLAWKSDLLLSASELLGIELGELLMRQLESEASGFARNDAFAKRDAAVSLEREAKARANGVNKHWMQAQVRLAPYDFERSGWPVQSISLRPTADAPPADQSLRIEYMQPRENGGYKEVFLPMDADTARTFQSGLQSFPDLDALVAFRISAVDTTYGTDFGPNIALVHEPVEIILFEVGMGGPVIDPDAVKFRHVFAPPPADPLLPADEAPATAAAGLPPGSFAVLGMKLGDDFDTTVEQLAQKIGAERRLYARTDMRQASLEAAGHRTIEDWEPFNHAVLLESRENSDMIAVYHEPPGAASTVTAIVRTKLFEPGAGPSWPSLRDTLLKSYPQIDAADFEGLDNPENVVVWDMPKRRPGEPVDVMESGCQRRVNSAAAGSLTLLYSFRRALQQDNMPVLNPRATWSDAEGAEARPITTPLFMAELFANSADCPPHEVMAFILLYGDDGRIVEFRQAVTMPVQVAAIAERRKSAAAEAATVDFDL